MTLYELVNRIKQYPLNVEVMLDVGKSKTVDFTVETVYEGGKVTGLIIVEDKQLKLPFDEPEGEIKIWT